MLPLKDKTVLVIGRGSGITRAIALAVSEDGGRVIAAGVTRTTWPTLIAAWVRHRAGRRHGRVLGWRAGGPDPTGS